MTTPVQTPIAEGLTLARFNINPARPAVEPIRYKTGGTMEVMLMNKAEHISVPLYLKNSSGKIRRYCLMKANYVDERTKATSRSLIPIWLLMSADPKCSGANERYIGNSNAGRLRELEENIIANAENPEKFPLRYNAAKVTGGFVPMDIVPNNAFGRDATGKIQWITNIYNIVTKLSNENLLGKRVGTGINDFTFLDPESKEYQSFIEKQHDTTEKILRNLVKKGMAEHNNVFYVEDNEFIPCTGTFHNMAYGQALLSKPEYRIATFGSGGLFSGLIRIHKDTNQDVTADGQKLEFGLRVIGAQRNAERYKFERTGSTFDSFGQVVNARLSLTDALTIRYLQERANAKALQQVAPDAEKVVDDENTSTDNAVLPGSRAARLEFIAQTRSCHLQFKNAGVRIYSNAKRDTQSMQINIEYVLDEGSEYYIVEDKSRMANVAQVDASGLFLDETVVDDAELSRILEAQQAQVVAKQEPAAAKAEKAKENIPVPSALFADDDELDDVSAT